MKFLCSIDLNKNELQNAVLQPLATAPSNPLPYQIYTDSTSGKIKQYINNTWKTVGVIVADSSTNGNITVDGVEMTVYELPTASSTTLGGVKVGTGLGIGADGKLYVTGDATVNSVEWDVVQNTPTTLAGYGITDAVQAVDGKGLSTNDYTTEEKTKLSTLSKRIFYGNCDTAINNSAKTVTVDSDFALTAGTILFIQFYYGISQSSQSPSTTTLNVNSTGAKQIRGSTELGTNDDFDVPPTGMVILRYDGNQWVYCGNRKANSLSRGLVRLSDSINSSYDTNYETAATPKAVYDLNQAKLDKNLAKTAASDSNKVITESDLSATVGNYVKKTDASGYGDILTATTAASTYVPKNGTDRLMTDAEGNKLAGIASGAEVNVNADWNATTGDAKILNKPTALSDFTNDEGFIDNTVNNLANYYKKTETYTQTEVNTLIGNLATIQISVVSSLPASGSSNVIYLVPKTGGTGINVKDEYLWTGSAFEKIGDTEIDLSGYLTKTGDGKDVTVSFTKATSRANIATGEKLSVIMGKLAKAFSDLSTVAFSGSYNDLSNKPTTIKNSTLTVSTSQTSNSATLTGTKILSVTVVDSVTHEVVFCDVDINNMTVTVSTSVAPTNALNATIAYM